MNGNRLLVWIVAIILLWETGAYLYNSANEYQLPSIYGAFTKDPYTKISRVSVITEGRVYNSVIDNSDIEFSNITIITIHTHNEIPISLSAYELSISLNTYQIPQIFYFDPILFGISNIWNKDKSVSVEVNMTGLSRADHEIQAQLISPEGNIVSTDIFRFSQEP